MAPRILLFSIVLGAEYSFYLKSITTYAPQKVNNNSFLGSVREDGEGKNYIHYLGTFHI
jgi:hypothetical protein